MQGALLTLIHVSTGLIGYRWAVMLVYRKRSEDAGLTISNDHSIASAKQNEQDDPDKALLHTHRFIIYTCVCALLSLFNIKVCSGPLICLIPLVYVLTVRDAAMQRFRSLLWQAILGHNNPEQDSVIVFADILTSYARVLPFLFDFLLDRVDVSQRNLVKTVLVAFPFWIRTRQCLNEMINKNDDWRPVVNAAKYATNFPIILLVFYYGRRGESMLLVALAVLNTMVNLTWDVLMDWRLPSVQMSRFDCFLIAFNVIVRLVNLSTLWINSVPLQLMISLEIMRRMTWLVLRTSACKYAQLV